MIEVDARGMRCPWPALRAARAMRGGTPVRVRADDPAASRELRALAEAHGWRFAEDGESVILEPDVSAP